MKRAKCDIQKKPVLPVFQFLVVVSLAAVALAEPEAEAGGWGGYKTYKHHARAYHAPAPPPRKVGRF